MEPHLKANEPGKPDAIARGCLVVLVLLFVIRGGSLGLMAFQDTTESRYVEVSLDMARTGDPVTPRLYMWGSQVPYLGKPPLHFWLTALSFQVLGASEWAARVPGFLGGLFIVGFTGLFARRFWGASVGLLSMVILASSAMFLVLMGVCMIGMTLSATLVAAMVAFAFSVDSEGRRGRRRWGYVFFLALGLGLLAKGPVALALAGLSLGLWCFWNRRWKPVATLPWISGMLLLLAVAAPWYLLAERANPGFLKYFFYHEHVLRYLVSDYGDRYGRGHEYLYGAAWPLLAATFLPWTLFLIGILFARPHCAGEGEGEPARKWRRYVLVWGLTPAVFFTFSKNLVSSYFLPGFPALAVFVAVGLDRWRTSPAAPALLHLVRWHGVLPFLLLLGVLCLGIHHQAAWPLVGVTSILLLGSGVLGIRILIWPRGLKDILVPAAFMPVILVIAGLNALPFLDGSRSTRLILQGKAAEDRTIPIIFPYGVPSSANFYAPDQVVHQPAEGMGPFRAELHDLQPDLYILRMQEWEKLPETVRKRLRPVERVGKWLLAGEVP